MASTPTGASDADLARSRAASLPVVEMLAPEFGLADPGRVRDAPDHFYAARVADAYRLLERVAGGEPDAASPAAGTPFATLATTLAEDCAADPDLWLETMIGVSIQTAAYLSLDDGVRLWRRLSASCASAGHRRPWLRLFAAVAERDAAVMAVLASELLGRSREADLSRQQYLLGAAVLGMLAAVRPDEAAPLWWSERVRLFGDGPLPFHLQVLESLLESPR